jgi:dTDP-4-dehydrorhamnose reductase
MHGSNFVTRLIQRARNNRELKVVDDQTGSPTATSEVAKAICKLLPRKPEGLFHFASDGYVSRFGMANFVLDRLAMEVELSPCRSSDYASPAARPLNSRCGCSKIKALLDEPIAPWQGPLETFLRQL